MKYLASLFLIVSIAGVSIFGLAMFDHGMHGQTNNSCLGSAISGTDCPTSLVAMTLHHISALQTLTTTTIPSNYTVLLLLASLILVSASIFLYFKTLLLPKLVYLPQRLQELSIHSRYSRQKIVSWLSLFELSPSM